MGHSEAYLLDLDLLAFNSLVETQSRLDAISKIEAAYTAMIAAQATEKTMKDWIVRWREIAGDDAQASDDQERFKATFGGGI